MENVPSAYLDLNIFDRIEKIETLENEVKANYLSLKQKIENKQLFTAYSNAHINDLFRGYQKNPTYVEGHLKNIEYLTNNNCVCQYWNQSNVVFHKRNIFEFFNEKNKEWEFETETYDELISDVPLLRMQAELKKNIPLPENFKKGYSEPIFALMFPLSKIYNNQYSLEADLYAFQNKFKSDYSLYKTIKKFLALSLKKLKNNQGFTAALRNQFKDLPIHLDLTDIYDVFTPNTKTGNNVMYSKILETFYKFDLAGYKTDSNFNNMFDDSLHTFYAAHFDYFITNDERCRYKAQKTYNKLGILTQVITSNEISKIEI